MSNEVNEALDVLMERLLIFFREFSEWKIIRKITAWSRLTNKTPECNENDDKWVTFGSPCWLFLDVLIMLKSVQIIALFLLARFQHWCWKLVLITSIHETLCSTFCTCWEFETSEKTLHHSSLLFDCSFLFMLNRFPRNVLC